MIYGMKWTKLFWGLKKVKLGFRRGIFLLIKMSMLLCHATTSFLGVVLGFLTSEITSFPWTQTAEEKKSHFQDLVSCTSAESQNHAEHLFSHLSLPSYKIEASSSRTWYQDNRPSASQQPQRFAYGAFGMICDRAEKTQVPGFLCPEACLWNFILQNQPKAGWAHKLSVFWAAHWSGVNSMLIRF